jgi:hypothetical protein
MHVQASTPSDGLLNRLSATATPKVRQRVRKPVPETRCVDLFLVLRMLIMEYREEQAHRCVGRAVCLYPSRAYVVFSLSP